MASKNILLCAGGTGGHLFPAEALAHELVKRGYTIHLATDERVERFMGHFPAAGIHKIRSATIGSKNPARILLSLSALLKGYRQSQSLLKTIDPVVVAGFGGYPTVPPLFAASRIGLPTLIHEQNAVFGRANRFLLPHVSLAATGFESPGGASGNVVVTGNPVRPTVVSAASRKYPDRKPGDPFNLLVLGGSQGAAFFNQIVSAACAELTEEYRKRLRVVQQARPEGRDKLEELFGNLGIKAEVETFFDDMPARISNAHLVLSRAGASTVSELSVIGRPAILVPYPHALDHDQAANAASMAKSGGAEIVMQAELSAGKLATLLKSSMDDPKKLALAAEKAKKTGKPHAAKALADCLEQIVTR